MPTVPHEKNLKKKFVSLNRCWTASVNKSYFFRLTQICYCLKYKQAPSRWMGWYKTWNMFFRPVHEEALSLLWLGQYNSNCVINVGTLQLPGKWIRYAGLCGFYSYNHYRRMWRPKLTDNASGVKAGLISYWLILRPEKQNCSGHRLPGHR